MLGYFISSSWTIQTVKAAQHNFWLVLEAGPSPPQLRRAMSAQATATGRQRGSHPPPRRCLNGACKLRGRRGPRRNRAERALLRPGAQRGVRLAPSTVREGEGCSRGWSPSQRTPGGSDTPTGASRAFLRQRPVWPSG